MENRIKYLQDRLGDLRKDWREASPAMKRYIEQGAKLFKLELKALEKRLAKENQEKII